MKRTFYQWAEAQGACEEALEYLLCKSPTLETWLGSCGSWRSWVAMALDVAVCSADALTFHGCRDACCERSRADINEPRRHAAIVRHFRRVVLPALRRAGVVDEPRRRQCGLVRHYREARP